jgi:tetraacyldisaccharide 4'-kinase
VSALYRLATTGRNALYDTGILRVARPPIPLVSIGNLTVGGTGKTPVSAWIASSLAARGRRPAVILRGYGGDESRVHTVLNPHVPVFTGADRVSSVAAAAAAGANVGVLDDAFQHRRIGRDEDVVLVSADRWSRRHRLLPAGPWREPLSALGRASMVIVTRKASDRAAAESLSRHLAPLTRRNEAAVVQLSLDVLHTLGTSRSEPLRALEGARVMLVSGIGDPGSLHEQLRAVAGEIDRREFPDHHVYTNADTERLARDASVVDYVVCTLKDAVKLGPLWPREAKPLWYVSQRCEVESGDAVVSAMLDRLIAAPASHDNQPPASGAQHRSFQ